MCSLVAASAGISLFQGLAMRSAAIDAAEQAYQVEVTPQNRDTSTHEFTGRLLGSASAAIGEINLDTGTFKVPIMSKSDRVNIDIKNNTFLPTRLASAEYEGIFHIRSRRV